MGIKYIYLF